MQPTALLHALRPRHWTKNLTVFAGILFSQNLTNLSMLAQTIAAFVVFCLLSGMVYLVNDLTDIEKDRQHPIKSRRPLASGRLSVPVAVAAALILGFGSVGWAWWLRLPFATLALGYVGLQLLYSFVLKKLVILDVFTIAAGFLLRVLAGAVLIDVEISSWLIICTILLALFLALSKRRHEMTMLETIATSHRDVLREYSPYLLDQMIGVVSASTVIAYSLYTISDQTIQKFETRNLLFTIPFVLYGVFRYLYLIHQRKAGGRPEYELLTDLPLLLDVLGWVATVGIVLYLV